MHLIIPELDCMILERVNGTSLRNVARVVSEWRTFIANNIHKMRQISCYQLNVYFLINGRYHIDVHRDKEDSARKIHYSNNALQRYLPTTMLLFLCEESMLNSERRHVENLISVIPSWWIKQIGKIQLMLFDIIFSRIATHIKHISKLCYYAPPEDDQCSEHSIQIIERTQKVDQYIIQSSMFDRSVKEALIRKSFTHPTEFPIVYDVFMTLEDFIDFINRIRFREDVACHKILVHLSSTHRQWHDWIQQNTTESCLSEPRREEHVFSSHRFRYREKHFQVDVIIKNTYH